MSAATTGYSQQEPTDSSSDLNVAIFTIRQWIARMATMIPAVVKSVQGGGGALGAAGTVSVQPLVTMLDGSGNAMPHGVLASVPYYRAQGGTAAIILDPAVGDVGYVHFAMRDISSVVASGGAVSTPGSLRQYNMADGIYVGGILNETPTQYIQFSASGITIADGNGNVITMSGSGVAITGNLMVTGTVTGGYGGADQVGLTTHKHTANNTPPTPGT